MKFYQVPSELSSQNTEGPRVDALKKGKKGIKKPIDVRLEAIMIPETVPPPANIVNLWSKRSRFFCFGVENK
jgi:hypothetical protein